MRVLLVDDDEDDQQAFSEALQKINPAVEVVQARDSRELFLHLERDAGFNIIFMDINLPVDDGKKCLAEIKSKDPLKHIPVIMYTVSSDEKDIEYSYNSGAHYYIVKPYAHINFIEALKRVFATDWTVTQPIPQKEHFVINLAFT